jgi:hypothetical protein
MTEWEITYTKDRNNFEKAIIVASTYTKALLEFMRNYPSTEYTNIKELIK